MSGLQPKPKRALEAPSPPTAASLAPPPKPHALGKGGWTQEAKAWATAYWNRYKDDVERFIIECVHIQIQPDGKGEGAEGGVWVPFALWPAQRKAARTLRKARRGLALKARQNGFSWLTLAVGLHSFVFGHGSTGLVVSLRETEAVELLRRFKGMYARLPGFLKARAIAKDDATFFEVSTGSRAIALPANRGDSYTAKWVLVDEASLVPDLSGLLSRLEPTIADGGQLWLVSRANGSDPEGLFARLARAGLVEGGGQWEAVFSPWRDRPGRSQAWYEEQKRLSLEKDGTLDQLREQYPATPEEALAPRSGDKRLPPDVLALAYERSTPLPHSVLPRGLSLPSGVDLLVLPVDGRRFVIGADPAEGLQSGDDSALSVLDAETGEEVACGAGKWEPKTDFPAILCTLSKLYKGAPVLVERNNHGHATIGRLTALGVPLLDGPDGREGLAKSGATKAQVWDEVWGEVRDRSEARATAPKGKPLPPPLLRSPKTYLQAGSIERTSLKAPTGQHDDRADAWALALWARTRPSRPTPQQTARALKGLRS